MDRHTPFARDLHTWRRRVAGFEPIFVRRADDPMRRPVPAVLDVVNRTSYSYCSGISINRVTQQQGMGAALRRRWRWEENGLAHPNPNVQTRTHRFHRTRQDERVARPRIPEAIDPKCSERSPQAKSRGILPRNFAWKSVAENDREVALDSSQRIVIGVGRNSKFNQVAARIRECESPSAHSNPKPRARA